MRKSKHRLVTDTHPPHYCTMQLHERLKGRLQRRDRIAIRAPDALACAVLVALVPEGEAYSVLYTLRSEDLPNHQGQVSFPGGKLHPEVDRSLLDTALREAEEEVGIQPRDVEILGELDDVSTMAASYVITPVVGLLPAGYVFHPNPAEVSDVFTVTMEDLRDPRYRATERREFNGTEYEISMITAGRHIIWGATHRITIDLLRCVDEAEH